MSLETSMPPLEPVTWSTVATGIKFDVGYLRGRTDLVLLQGSVRLRTSGNRWMEVTTGHALFIEGESASTPQRKVDALTAPAWARDFLPVNALAGMGEFEEEDYRSLSRGMAERSVDPESVDPDTWLKAHSDSAWQLLTNDGHFTGCMVSCLPSVFSSREALMAYLSSQVTTAYTVSSATQELLTTPKTPDCSSQSTLLGRHLHNQTLALVPEE